MRITSASLFFLLLCGCTHKARVATALTNLADAPSTFVIYSLDPGPVVHDKSINTATVFHGYGILGRAEITDTDERRTLMRALARGTRESDGGVGMCFNPRHGLRVEQNGRSLDFVIRFECLRVHAYNFQLGGEILTSASPQATFDDSLRHHQLPLASP